MKNRSGNVELARFIGALLIMLGHFGFVVENRLSYETFIFVEFF